MNVSDDAFRVEHIETPAGTYTVELHYDDDSSNPLTDWDHEGMAFYIWQGANAFYGQGVRPSLDTLSDAGDAGDTLSAIMQKLGEYRYGGFDPDEVARWYSKWRAITGSSWILFSGSGNGSVQSHWWNWFVLVEGDRFTPSPEMAARATMNDYQMWARGEVCGYVTKSPDGEHVDSCWGFYDDDEALEQGKTSAEYDAANRVDAANLVGAGFVGIV